jgi:hypothetical protein
MEVRMRIIKVALLVMTAWLGLLNVATAQVEDQNKWADILAEITDSAENGSGAGDITLPSQWGRATGLGWLGLDPAVVGLPADFTFEPVEATSFDSLTGPRLIQDRLTEILDGIVFLDSATDSNRLFAELMSINLSELYIIAAGIDVCVKIKCRSLSPTQVTLLAVQAADVRQRANDRKLQTEAVAAAKAASEAAFEANDIAKKSNGIADKSSKTAVWAFWVSVAAVIVAVIAPIIVEGRRRKKPATGSDQKASRRSTESAGQPVNTDAEAQEPPPTQPEPAPAR